MSERLGEGFNSVAHHVPQLAVDALHALRSRDRLDDMRVADGGRVLNEGEGEVGYMVRPVEPIVHKGPQQPKWIMRRWSST